jgi:hypothetical protein
VPERRSLQRLTADEIISALNSALVAEIQAVADYGAHAQATDQPEVRQALETLRDVEREHAMRLLARISTLGGMAVDQSLWAIHLPPGWHRIYRESSGPLSSMPGWWLVSWMTTRQSS